MWRVESHEQRGGLQSRGQEPKGNVWQEDGDNSGGLCQSLKVGISREGRESVVRGCVSPL